MAPFPATFVGRMKEKNEKKKEISCINSFVCIHCACDWLMGFLGNKIEAWIHSR